jgi:nucleotide-binding universal stress UspA family protein
MFNHILVATDFSEPSAAAVEYARTLATSFGSTLHLLHVVEAPSVTGPLGTPVFVSEGPALQGQLFEEAKERLEDLVTPADRSHGNVVTEVIVGTAARTILDFAADHDMDLIVVGTHGRSGMAHLLMGSVAEKVVRGALCPVLTVRKAVERVPVAMLARIEHAV